MSVAERQKWQGQLIEKNLRARDLEGRLNSMRELLRDHLNPHVPLADLKMDTVAGVAVAAEELWREYQQVLLDIANLKLSLGER